MIRTTFFALLIAFTGVYGAVVFGPVSYYRTTGAPDIYDTTFVAYDTTVACTLIVTASIEFNGEEIIKERDFSESVETITRVLQLRSENSIHLRLRSGPGDFLTLNINRPCDAFVTLKVDTVIGDSACFTATASGWGALTYSWDLDGDGEYDTITTENTICHKYEEADTYWARVRVEDEVGCEGEDSVEVIIKKEEYTFDVVMTEEVWEGKDFYPTDWIFDDEGTPWILGYAKEDSNAYYMISDTLGNIDTLYSLEFADVDIPQAPIWIKDRHILHRYFSNIDDTVIYGIDTVVHTRLKFDSLTVTPIFGNGPSWKFIHKFIEPIAIRGNGWAFVKIIQSNEADSVYPGWKYAIAHNGEPDVKIDIEGEVWPIWPDESIAIKVVGSYLAINTVSPALDSITISLFDTSGNFLYSKNHLSDRAGKTASNFVLIDDGTMVYVDGIIGNAVIKKSTLTEEYSYPIEYDELYLVCNNYSNYRLLVTANSPQSIGSSSIQYLYYFDIADSLKLVWSDTLAEDRRVNKLLSNGDIISWYSEAGTYLRSIRILSSENGGFISSWSNRALQEGSCKIHENLISIRWSESNPHRTHFLLVRVQKGGE